MTKLLMRGSNVIFSVLTFAKPECDNVLLCDQGCNTLLHEGLDKTLKHRKRMLYRHCYIPSTYKPIFIF